MTTKISTKTSGVGGLEVTGDASGILELASNNGTTAVTIDASQNVGIGTASPSAFYKLTVNQNDGGIAITAPSTKYALLSIAGNGNTLASTSFDILQDSATAYIYNRANTPMVFATNATERMRIDSGGMLVNVTTSSFTNANAFILSTTNGDLSVMHNNTRPSGSAYVWFTYNGSPIGSITQNGTTAVAYNTSSDYRLKEDIAPMVDALDTIAQLKPVTYKWKSDGSDGQGFIAHELQEVVPDCVTGEKDAVNEDGSIKPQGIDTSFLVATLTAAIQELKAIVDTQAERIAVLEGK